MPKRDKTDVALEEVLKKCKACFVDGLLLLEKELPAFKEALGNLLFQLNPEIWEIAWDDDDWLEQPRHSCEEIWDDLWEQLVSGMTQDFHIGEATRGTDRGTVYICPITPEKGNSAADFYPVFYYKARKSTRDRTIYGYVLEVEHEDRGGYRFSSDFNARFYYRRPEDMLAEFQRKYGDCLPKDFPYKERLGRFYFAHFNDWRCVYVQ